MYKKYVNILAISRGPGSIPGAFILSEKKLVWNGTT
jgi:hypothetical protein